MNAFRLCARREEKEEGREKKRTKMFIQEIASFSKYIKFGLLHGAYRVKSSFHAEMHCIVCSSLINIGLDCHI